MLGYLFLSSNVIVMGLAIMELERWRQEGMTPLEWFMYWTSIAALSVAGTLWLSVLFSVVRSLLR